MVHPRMGPRGWSVLLWGLEGGPPSYGASRVVRPLMGPRGWSALLWSLEGGPPSYGASRVVRPLMGPRGWSALLWGLEGAVVRPLMGVYAMVSHNGETK